MNYLISVLSIALSLSFLTACGGGSGTPGGTSAVDDQSECPVGEFYSTNGNRDFISVGNDGTFSMERSYSTASGYITCLGNQDFMLTIEASEGNCPAEKHCKDQYPRDMNEITYFNTQGVGVYKCHYSIAEYTFNVRCTGMTYEQGNFFSTAKTYYLPGYY